MRTIRNKEFKIQVNLLEQDSGNELNLIKTCATITLAQMLEPSLRKAPQGGFDAIDLKLLKDRIKALEKLENLLPNEDFEVEDAIFETIVKAGKDFKPLIATKEMLEFKEYFIELEEYDKKLTK